MTQYQPFLLTILLLAVSWLFPGIIYMIAGDSLSYWVVFGILIAIMAVCFGIWAVHGETKTLKGLTGNSEGTPRFKFYKRWLGWLFWAFIACCVVSCEYSWATLEEPVNKIATPASDQVWSADNIPLPHLTDGSQYVSNPDGVIQQSTVDSLNMILKQLDTNLEVESAIIIVNRVANADHLRMAQDVGNRVGIGTKELNRGLVIVVAYLDHKYFIAPGTGLEGDLTDAECSQLARTYLTPSLMAEDPDQAMMLLVSALSSLLEGKDMPSSTRVGEEDISLGGESMSLLMLMIWMFIYSGLNKKYKWLVFNNNGGTGYTGYGRDRTGMGTTYWGTGWPSGRGGGFGGGFGGGGFGGGYGGGSFGGGGAGGGW